MNVVGTLDEIDELLNEYSANIRTTEETEARIQKEVELQGNVIPYWIDLEKQEYGFNNIEKKSAFTKSYGEYDEFKDTFLTYVEIHSMLMPVAAAIVDAYIEESHNTIGRPNIRLMKNGKYAIVFQIKEYLKERLFVVKDVDDAGVYVAGEFAYSEDGTYDTPLHTTNFIIDEEGSLVEAPSEAVAEEPTEEPAEEETTEEEIVEEPTEEEIVEEPTEEPAEEEIVEEPVEDATDDTETEAEDISDTEEIVEDYAEEDTAESDISADDGEDLIIPTPDEAPEEPVYTEAVEDTVAEVSDEAPLVAGDDEIETTGGTIIVKTFTTIDEQVFVRFVIAWNGQVTGIKDVEVDKMVRYGFTPERISSITKEYRKCGVIIDQDVAKYGVAKILVSDTDDIKGLVDSVLAL